MQGTGFPNVHNIADRNQPRGSTSSSQVGNLHVACNKRTTNLRLFVLLAVSLLVIGSLNLASADLLLKGPDSAEFGGTESANGEGVDGEHTCPGALNPGSCPVPKLLEVLALAPPTCTTQGSGTDWILWTGSQCTAEAGRLVELNETSLSELLEALRSGSSKLRVAYVAVLYYATWCPFSRQLLPIYEALAEIHPSILHVAVEERIVRPSVLSRVGVHSFPALYVHNRTVRIRYQGPRGLQDLHAFYANITDVHPPGSWEDEEWSEASEGQHKARRPGEACPYPWAQHPEQLLQENACLVLASAFVVLRVLFWVAPRAIQWGKARWHDRASRGVVTTS